MTRIGYFGLIGMAALAGVMATGATGALASEGYECRNQTLGPVTIEGNLTVPAGAFCNLNGTHVTGGATAERAADAANPAGLTMDLGARVDESVRIERNGQFAAFGGSIVGGNVHCDRCEVADLHGSTVRGSLSAAGLSQGADIEGSHIGGNLVVRDGFDVSGFGYRYVANSIRGNFEFIHNTGVSNISGNTIGRSLTCRRNSPPPTGAGNTADDKQGQCALL